MSDGPNDLHGDAGVRLTIVSSEAEAAILQATLNAEGISSQVTGETVGTTLNYYGGAVCRVEILVHESKLDDARRVLREYEDRKRNQSHVEWVCSRCQEVNAGTFEACWACQKVRDESDQTHETSEPWSSGSPGTSDSDAYGLSPSEDSSNPYAPPMVADRTSRAMTRDVDGAIRRLRRAAILGIVIWPVAFVTVFFAIRTLVQIARGQLVVSREQSFAIHLYVVLILLESIGYPIIIVLF